MADRRCIPRIGPQGSGVTASEDLASPIASARVLVIDEHRRNVELLEMLLRQTGYGEVRGTTNSSEVVSLCASWRPDAILLDLGIPPSGGIALLEELAPLTEHGRRVPVLVHSADRDPTARRRAMALGADDFLAKPFDIAEVLLRLRNQLETRQLRRRLDALLPDAQPEADEPRAHGDGDSLSAAEDMAAASEPSGGSSRTLISLQEAADALSISASTLRRWADGGRIAAVRTQGGHRRFDPSALRTLKARLGEHRRPAVRPVAPPSRSMPTAARSLDRDGPAILRAALTALYRSDEPGWFASSEAEAPVKHWLATVVEAAHSGDYAVAIAATRSLERHATIGGATLLECHQFLGYFRAALVQVLTRRAVDREETASAHRLMACFEQRLLDEHDTELAGDVLRSA